MDHDPGGELILVVDEEPEGLLALQEMLQGSGYLMVTARTGAASRQIVVQRPDDHDQLSAARGSPRVSPPDGERSAAPHQPPPAGTCSSLPRTG